MYTLGDVPRKGAKLNPDKISIIFEGSRITYREMNERVNRLANALIDLGCKKGDRLAILSENTHKYMEVYFAAAKVGMSVTPLNFRLSNAELVHIVNDCEARLYLVGDGFEDRTNSLKPHLDAEEELLRHCKERLAGYKCPKRIEFWQDLPKTPIGKILRKDIKKRYWEGHEKMIG